MKQLTFPARSTTLTALAVLMLISGSLAGCFSDEEDAASGQETLATTPQAGEQPTTTTETVYNGADLVDWVFNTDDLVKHVDDVFIGSVLSAAESLFLTGESDIWTPYKVRVDQRLLGTVEGTITVAQFGGYDSERDIIVIFEEDLLLEVGETYMLATINNRTPDRPEWDELHFLAAAKGHVLFANEAHRQQLIQEYTEAIDQAGLGSQ